MMKIYSFLFCILLLLSLKTIAQEAISVSYNYGKIAIHTPKIKDVIAGPVSGYALNYIVSKYKGETWRKYYNFPNFGLSYIYKDYHNPDVLGNSHSVTGFIQMPFLPRRGFFDFGFNGSMGLGFFTKTFDPVSNPLNPAISSSVNITAEVGLYGKIRIKPIFLEFSFGLNHFSNGHVKAPNLGLNVLNNSFSLGYEFKEKENHEQIQEDEISRVVNHEFWATGSLGFKEINSDGKKYSFSCISINYSKQITVINKMGLGIDFLNDRSLTALAYQEYFYHERSSLNFRYGINVHNEFLFENTGLFMAYGIYLGETTYYSSRRYYKIGFKYYHKNLIGVVIIRAIPLFRADVLEFGIGYKLTKYKKK